MQRSFIKSGRRVALFDKEVGPIPRGHVLAIEIDGPHEEDRDARRDGYLLKNHKVYVVRFDASEIQALR
jgi:very-short-patch-repair endonuclease